MPLDALYSTPIYSDYIENEKLVSDEIDAAIQKINFSHREDWGITHLLSDSNFKENLIEKYNLKNLKNEIDVMLKQYLKGLFKLPENFEGELGDYFISHSWIAMFEKGHYGHIHSHGEADIAGVYYHKKPKGTSDLFFTCPVPGLEESIVTQKWGQRTDVKAPQGAMLLFPGWLKHGIQSNPLEEKRISVSFNIVFNREKLYNNEKIYH